jgi:ATPase subunit of ABC transporter with duplicated ATPase domains
MAQGSLIATGITKSYGALVVLHDVSVTISPDTRLGVIGPNGAGKTTLLRILGGLEAPDGGRVERAPPALAVGYLPQERDARGGETVLEYLSRRTGVAAAEAEVDALAAGLGSDPASVGDYTAALDAYVALGGDDLAGRAETVCADLGLGPDALGRELATLSGGEAARAALACVLLARFDVFLLDEPTNDLDFDGLARLEAFLERLQGGAVIVSHDRAFLERTVTRVLEIDRRVTEYGGGFAAYLEAKEHARAQAYAAFESYTAERDDLVARTHRIRAWSERGVRKAKAGSDEPDKHIKQRKIARSEKQASKVRSLERRLDRLERADKPWEPWDLRLDIASGPRAGDIVVRLQGAVAERGSFRLGPLSLEITRGERVAVAGANGTGKTTLIRAITGDLPLSDGRRYVGAGVVVGEMDQGRSGFGGTSTLIDSFVDASGLEPADARTLLAKFGLGADHVLRPCDTLSPGERTRAALAKFMAGGVNLLILDEPTNHLDLPAIEELEAALDTYDGTMLLVTHDRRFADNVRVTRTIEL